MPSRKRTIPPQHDTSVPPAGSGAGTLRRIGTKIGVLDLASADEAGAPVVNQVGSEPALTESVSPPSQEQPGDAVHVSLDFKTLKQELESLSRGLAEDAAMERRPETLSSVTKPKQELESLSRSVAEDAAIERVAETRYSVTKPQKELESLRRALTDDAIVQPVAGTLHDVLAQKKVALIGFGATEQEALQVLLGVQLSVPVMLDHSQAALVPAPWQDCDLIMVNAPPEWTITEPIDPGCWAHINKPILVFGTKDVLTRATRVIRARSGDFIPAPWTGEDLVWRGAMLLSRSPGTPPRLKPPGKSTKPEVVIAEDDPTTRALLSAMLSRHGMVCHVADNGGTALELVRGVHPDVAILDVSMPCLNGFQVLASIKQDPSLATTQVVLLTGRQTEVDVLQGFGLGADDYMTKPFSPMELAARVKRLLARVA